MQSYCFAFSLHNMRFLYEPSEGNAAFCARRETRGSLLHSRFYVSSRNAPKNGCVADYPSSRAPRSASSPSLAHKAPVMHSDYFAL